MVMFSLILFPTAASASRSQFGDTASTNLTQHLSVGGLTRSYVLHLPAAGDPSTKKPLLLVFHGHGENAMDIASMTGFDQIANRNGFIVAYPQGYKDSWNDGRGTTAAQLAGVNDTKFVRLLISHLEATLSVNPNRIYATGFSNGGMFTERLGCDLANTFAAIAPVAGPMAAPIAANCHSTRVLPVFEIQGTADPVVPYAGGTVVSIVRGKVLSTTATTSFWKRRDACKGSPNHLLLAAAPNDGTGVKIMRFANCADGSVVQLARVIGGLHKWPGAVNGSSSSTPGFHASSAIWRFLRQFSRVQPA